VGDLGGKPPRSTRRAVIADNDVEVTIAIDIREGGRVSTISIPAQGFGGESPFAIVAKDEIKQRPVAALRQDDVEIAVAVYVAKTDARGSLALGFQKQSTLKRACFRREGRLGPFGVDE
jgi:hypothetical protein